MQRLRASRAVGIACCGFPTTTQPSLPIATAVVSDGANHVSQQQQRRAMSSGSGAVCRTPIVRALRPKASIKTFADRQRSQTANGEGAADGGGSNLPAPPSAAESTLPTEEELVHAFLASYLNNSSSSSASAVPLSQVASAVPDHLMESDPLENGLGAFLSAHPSRYAVAAGADGRPAVRLILATVTSTSPANASPPHTSSHGSSDGGESSSTLSSSSRTDQPPSATSAGSKDAPRVVGRRQRSATSSTSATATCTAAATSGFVAATSTASSSASAAFTNAAAADSDAPQYPSAAGWGAADEDSGATGGTADRKGNDENAFSSSAAASSGGQPPTTNARRPIGHSVPPPPPASAASKLISAELAQRLAQYGEHKNNAGKNGGTAVSPHQKGRGGGNAPVGQRVISLDAAARADHLNGLIPSLVFQPDAREVLTAELPPAERAEAIYDETEGSYHPNKADNYICDGGGGTAELRTFSASESPIVLRVPPNAANCRLLRGGLRVVDFVASQKEALARVLLGGSSANGAGDAGGGGTRAATTSFATIRAPRSGAEMSRMLTVICERDVPSELLVPAPPFSLSPSSSSSTGGGGGVSGGGSAGGEVRLTRLTACATAEEEEKASSAGGSRSGREEVGKNRFHLREAVLTVLEGIANANAHVPNLITVVAAERYSLETNDGNRDVDGVEMLSHQQIFDFLAANGIGAESYRPSTSPESFTVAYQQEKTSTAVSYSSQSASSVAPRPLAEVLRRHTCADILSRFSLYARINPSLAGALPLAVPRHHEGAGAAATTVSATVSAAARHVSSLRAEEYHLYRIARFVSATGDGTRIDEVAAKAIASGIIDNHEALSLATNVSHRPEVIDSCSSSASSPRAQPANPSSRPATAVPTCDGDPSLPLRRSLQAQASALDAIASHSIISDAEALWDEDVGSLKNRDNNNAMTKRTIDTSSDDTNGLDCNDLRSNDKNIATLSRRNADIYQIFLTAPFLFDLLGPSSGASVVSRHNENPRSSSTIGSVGESRGSLSHAEADEDDLVVFRSGVEMMPAAPATASSSSTPTRGGGGSFISSGFCDAAATADAVVPLRATIVTSARFILDIKYLPDEYCLPLKTIQRVISTVVAEITEARQEQHNRIVRKAEAAGLAAPARKKQPFDKKVIRLRNSLKKLRFAEAAHLASLSPFSDPNVTAWIIYDVTVEYLSRLAAAQQQKPKINNHHQRLNHHRHSQQAAHSNSDGGGGDSDFSIRDPNVVGKQSEIFGSGGGGGSSSSLSVRLSNNPSEFSFDGHWDRLCRQMRRSPSSSSSSSTAATKSMAANEGRRSGTSHINGKNNINTKNSENSGYWHTPDHSLRSPAVSFTASILPLLPVAVVRSSHTSLKMLTSAPALFDAKADNLDVIISLRDGFGGTSLRREGEHRRHAIPRESVKAEGGTISPAAGRSEEEKMGATNACDDHEGKGAAASYSRTLIDSTGSGLTSIVEAVFGGDAHDVETLRCIGEETVRSIGDQQKKKRKKNASANTNSDGDEEWTAVSSEEDDAAAAGYTPHEETAAARSDTNAQAPALSTTSLSTAATKTALRSDVTTAGGSVAARSQLPPITPPPPAPLTTAALTGVFGRPIGKEGNVTLVSHLSAPSRRSTLIYDASVSSTSITTPTSSKAISGMGSNTAGFSSLHADAALMPKVVLAGSSRSLRSIASSVHALLLAMSDGRGGGRRRRSRSDGISSKEESALQPEATTKGSSFPSAASLPPPAVPDGEVLFISCHVLAIRASTADIVVPMSATLIARTAAAAAAAGFGDGFANSARSSSSASSVSAATAAAEGGGEEVSLDIAMALVASVVRGTSLPSGAISLRELALLAHHGVDKGIAMAAAAASAAEGSVGRGGVGGGYAYSSSLSDRLALEGFSMAELIRMFPHLFEVRGDGRWVRAII